jgi:hypothetical protein
MCKDLGVCFGSSRGIGAHVLDNVAARFVGGCNSRMTGRGSEGPSDNVKKFVGRAVSDTIVVSVYRTANTINKTALVGALVIAIWESIAIRVFWTTKAVVPSIGNVVIRLWLVDSMSSTMLRLGAMDGIIALVDSIMHTVLIRVKGTAISADHRNEFEARVVGRILVAVETKIGLIGHEVTVTVRAAQNVQMFGLARNPVSRGGSGWLILELSIKGKGSKSWAHETEKRAVKSD